jgi:hypothetical protein
MLIGEADGFFRTLRALGENPLILRQAFSYWKRHDDFPRRTEVLFRSWLDTVLETERDVKH